MSITDDMTDVEMQEVNPYISATPLRKLVNNYVNSDIQTEVSEIKNKLATSNVTDMNKIVKYTVTELVREVVTDDSGNSVVDENGELRYRNVLVDGKKQYATVQKQGTTSEYLTHQLEQLKSQRVTTNRKYFMEYLTAVVNLFTRQMLEHCYRTVAIKDNSKSVTINTVDMVNDGFESLSTYPLFADLPTFRTLLSTRADVPDMTANNFVTLVTHIFKDMCENEQFVKDRSPAELESPLKWQHSKLFKWTLARLIEELTTTVANAMNVSLQYGSKNSFEDKDFKKALTFLYVLRGRDPAEFHEQVTAMHEFVSTQSAHASANRKAKKENPPVVEEPKPKAPKPKAPKAQAKAPAKPSGGKRKGKGKK